ncbi:NitT/TauT family transport system ATP-binding protein [Rhodovulum sp. ES.010]|uniref:ABC transporter ATP-binding protein n=1 Tax=Rhodovulum sp. ES.010 TaxID=1882821 RepID=UPI000926EBD6|nr:ATP-binding cassette domain-containing protein [Rhodovulum sp. ES.010]SIO25685.1 NitT/TauT family transport system ATP-binding protein [Rhodovulum sp. ES.010]
MTGILLRLEGVEFAYDGAPVLSGIDLALPAGQFTGVIGPSGCGKSTLVALAAGLIAPDAGRVLRHDRRLGIVFQDPALLPWRTALGNVAFPLLGQGLTRSAHHARAVRALDQVGLAPEDARKYPRQLSGGMRQRVALARALAVAPDLLLCDEPFGALDNRVRRELRARLRAIHDRTGLTTLFVTHDQDEAMEIADLVVVMSTGQIEQVAPPAELRAHPANAFVCAFTAA